MGPAPICFRTLFGQGHQYFPGWKLFNPYQISGSKWDPLFYRLENQHGQEIWKIDGTEAGTVLVKDIFPGGDWSFPGDFINVNGILFFVDPDNCSNYRSQGEVRYVHISEVDDSPLSTCHHGLCGGEPAVESAVECDSVIVLARGHQ